MANVKSEGHMLITAGRAYSCFETRSPASWTSPGPDMCFVLPEKIHNLSEAVACCVSTSHLVTGVLFFGTMSYSERHGNESYIISDAPERRKKEKARAFVSRSMHCEQGNSCSLYLNRTVEHVNGSDSSFLNTLLQVETN